MIAVVVTNGVSLVTLQPIIDQIFVAPGERVSFPVPGIGGTVGGTKTELLFWLTAFFVATRVVYCAALYVQRFLMMLAGEIMVNRLRVDLYDHLLVLSPSWYARKRSGETISNLTADLGLVQHLASTVTADLVRRPFEIVFLVGLLVWFDPLLAGASLLVAPFVVGIVRVLGKSIRKRSARMQEGMADIAARLAETVGGIRIVQAFAAEETMKARFRRAAAEYLERARRAYLATAAATPATEFVTALAIAAIILYGGGTVIAGRLTPGSFFAFMAILMATYQPVKTLVNALSEASRAAAALDRVYAVLDTVPSIVSRANRPAEFRHELSLEKVTFSYDAVPKAEGGSEAALVDITLSIRRGETVALVGPSGAGKSTLLSLLTRFHDPVAGRITLDGIDLRDLDLVSLRRLTGLVTQETFLFNDSIEANIALGRSGATRAEIEAAAEAAHILDFVRRLPDGFETVVGERGTRLSGGEKQRIAIARSLLVDPPILLLDEATSSLDSESEKHVQAAIERLIEGRTTLVIAHRLSTVQRADRIVVLDRGRIVEEGRHADLLARNGLYARLHAIQFQS